MTADVINQLISVIAAGNPNNIVNTFRKLSPHFEERHQNDILIVCSSLKRAIDNVANRLVSASDTEFLINNSIAGLIYVLGHYTQNVDIKIQAMKEPQPNAINLGLVERYISKLDKFIAPPEGGNNNGSYVYNSNTRTTFTPILEWFNALSGNNIPVDEFRYAADFDMGVAMKAAGIAQNVILPFLYEKKSLFTSQGVSLPHLIFSLRCSIIASERRVLLEKMLQALSDSAEREALTAFLIQPNEKLFDLSPISDLLNKYSS